MTVRALDGGSEAGSVQTMAHPTSANTTVIDREGWPELDEGFGGLRITGCWLNEAHLLEGVPCGVTADGGTGC